MKYSGIDLHSNNSVMSVTDGEDRVVAERRLPNDLSKIVAFLARIQTCWGRDDIRNVPDGIESASSFTCGNTYSDRGCLRITRHYTSETFLCSNVIREPLIPLEIFAPVDVGAIALNDER